MIIDHVALLNWHIDKADSSFSSITLCDRRFTSLWTCQNVSMKTKIIIRKHSSMTRASFRCLVALISCVKRGTQKIIGCQPPKLSSPGGIHWRIVESAWWWLRQIPLESLCICESRTLLTHFRRSMTLNYKMGIRCKFNLSYLPHVSNVS